MVREPLSQGGSDGDHDTGTLRYPPRPSVHSPRATDDAMDTITTTTELSASPDMLVEREPVKDAVNSAFQASDVPGQMSEVLVARITEQVMNNLRLNGIQPTAAKSSSESIPPRDVYTPPSPDRDDLERGRGAMYEQPAEPVTAYRHSFASTDASRPPISRTSSNITTDADHDGVTTLERIWQPLFDSAGNPTARLGQFLRGLANYLIEDYEPKQSLVITPAKMAKFYDEVALPLEIYPWSIMFGGRMKNSHISYIYRDLQCEHHFVQASSQGKPSIPGLTPRGFETWMVHLIQAHPEEEFQRFAMAVLHMPISNADDCRERFPKQLSRRLFPAKPDNDVQMQFEEAILAEGDVKSSDLHKQPASKTFQAQASAATATPMFSNRVEVNRGDIPVINPNRQSFSTFSSDAFVSEPSEDESNGPSVPIERERKPYSAQPGRGKVHESEGMPPRSQTISLGGSSRNENVRSRNYTMDSQATPKPFSRTANPTSSRSEADSSSYSSQHQQASRGSSNAAPSDSEDDANKLRRTRSERSKRYMAEGQFVAAPPPSSYAAKRSSYTPSSQAEPDYYARSRRGTNSSAGSHRPQSSTRH